MIWNWTAPFVRNACHVRCTLPWRKILAGRGACRLCHGVSCILNQTKWDLKLNGKICQNRMPCPVYVTVTSNTCRASRVPIFPQPTQGGHHGTTPARFHSGLATSPHRPTDRAAVLNSVSNPKYLFNKCSHESCLYTKGAWHWTLFKQTSVTCQISTLVKWYRVTNLTITLISYDNILNRHVHCCKLSDVAFHFMKAGNCVCVEAQSW